MRILAIFSLFFMAFGLFAPPAQAGALDMVLCAFYPCSGGGNFDRPYLEDGKTPHNVQWESDDWAPQDWIAAKGSAQEVVSGFYKAGIITDQSHTLRTHTPVVEVGQGFMRLSGRDKRRVIAMIDYVGQYTKTSPTRSILIEHKASGDEIGFYTAETGLQLQ